MPGLGHNSYLGVGKATVWGTAVAASKYVELENEGIKLSQPQNMPTSARNLSKRRKFQGKTLCEGPAKMQLFYEGFLEFWRALFGTYAYSAPGTTAKEHTFTLANALPIGLTLRVGRDLNEFIYPTMKPTKCTWDFALDNPAKATIEFAGHGVETTTTLGTPTFPADALLINPNQIIVKYGAVEKNAKAASISFDNALDLDRRFFGSALMAEPTRNGGPRIATGTVNLEFEALADYQLFVNATETVIVILAAGDEIEGGHDYEFELTINRAVFSGETPKVEGPGPIQLNMPFEAMYDVSGSKDLVTLRVKNTEAQLS